MGTFMNACDFHFLKASLKVMHARSKSRIRTDIDLNVCRICVAYSHSGNQADLRFLRIMG